MRHSSIGSPYVKAITSKNPSRFFSTACAASIPATVFAGLKSLCPRALEAHGIPALPYSVTARVFSYPAMSGDLGVLTTCSIFSGGTPKKVWSEFAMLSPSLVLALETTHDWQAIPDKGSAARSFLVWTSQKTFGQEVRRKLALSSGMLKPSQSLERSGV